MQWDLFICYFLILFFFFQAEDGIRDATVTGVQTCALPICARGAPPRPTARYARMIALRSQPLVACSCPLSLFVLFVRLCGLCAFLCGLCEIGRASCRERVSFSVVAVGFYMYSTCCFFRLVC